MSRTLERSFSSEPAVLPPIALLPSAFPQELYTQAVDVQEALAELYFRVACDRAFLLDAFRDVIRTDEFMARKVGIARAVHDEGRIRQPMTVALHRADYLAHWEPERGTLELKQVTAKTIT